MNETVSFRSIRDDDVPFLASVYASTRADEMALTGWNDQQQQTFLKMQFDAQHAYYQEHFPEAEYSLVLADGEPIGRLYIDRREDEIRIIDVALLTKFRGRGIGGRIMDGILAEGAEAGKPVRIHVLRENRALRLYERLGFQNLEEKGPYNLMEWTPTGVCADESPCRD